MSLGVNYSQSFLSKNAEYNKKQNNSKPSKGRYIGGFFAGSTVTILPLAMQQFIALTALKKIKKIGKNLTPKELEQVNNAANTMLKNTGLQSEYGVEILKVTKPDLVELINDHKSRIKTGKSTLNTLDNTKKVTDILAKIYEKNIIGKLLPEKYKQKICKECAMEIANGNNACYIFPIKKILISDKLAPASFHELGHAMNANMSKIGKILQKSRNLSFFAIPIALIALTKNKKQNGEKPRGAWDKFTTFVKNNAGKLTFAAFLPVVIEEGMASIKGQKFAKQLLTPELYKKVVKTNIFGFSSYLALTILSVGIYLGTKIRDKIVHKN